MVLGFVWWVVGIACAVWVIYDVLTQQQEMEDTHKVLWALAAVFFSIITAVVYYFVYKR